jgi:hypothetical protein
MSTDQTATRDTATQFNAVQTAGVTQDQVNRATASLAADPAALDAAVQTSHAGAAPENETSQILASLHTRVSAVENLVSGVMPDLKEALARLDENLPALQLAGTVIGEAVPAAVPLVSRMTAAENTLQSILTALHSHFGAGKITSLPATPHAPVDAKEPPPEPTEQEKVAAKFAAMGMPADMATQMAAIVLQHGGAQALLPAPS